MKENRTKCPTTHLLSETLAEAKTVDQKSINFIHPTQDISERFSKCSKAFRILSYVYRICDRASFTRKNGIRHDSIVLDRTILQSIDVRFNRLLSHPSIKLDAIGFETIRGGLIILCQTQYFNREYDGYNLNDHPLLTQIISTYSQLLLLTQRFISDSMF